MIVQMLNTAPIANVKILARKTHAGKMLFAKLVIIERFVYVLMVTVVILNKLVQVTNVKRTKIANLINCVIRMGLVEILV